MRHLALVTMMLVCASGAAQAKQSLPPGNDDSALTDGEGAAPQGVLPSSTAPDLSSPAPGDQDVVIKDPFERFNRKMYAFNSRLDKYFLAPLAIGYAKATPRRLRRGIANALDNVSSPVTFGNDVLQLRFKRAGVTLGRLILNSTVGLGGFFDVANKLGLEKHQEDFGQTVARYGAPSGPYLYLPFFGPTTIRDALSQPVDIVMDPLTWVEFGGFKVLRWSRVGLGALDARVDALRPLAEIQHTSPDPYVTIRTYYTLARRSAIANGRTKAEDLPEFGDPLEFDDAPQTAATEAEQPAEPTPAPDAADAPAPGGQSPPSDAPQHLVQEDLAAGALIFPLSLTL